MSKTIRSERIQGVLWSLVLAVATSSMDTNAASLLGHDIPAYLEFSSPVYSTPQDLGSAVITVVRTGEFREPVSVKYSTQDGTAQAGQDYTPVNGTLVIPAGVGFATFSVPILVDQGNDGNESVLLVLSQASPNGLITRAKAVLNILNSASTPALPTLTVRPDGQGGIVISWPATVAGCVLEKSDRASGGDWVTVSAIPEIKAGVSQVVEATSTGHFFYRLRLP